MTLNEFETALGRYGGELTRWPEAERKAAVALIAADPDAAKLHAEELKASALLRRFNDATPDAGVDAATIGRILAGIEPAARAERPFRPTRRLAAFAGAAMAASLMIGFVAGIALPSSDGEDALAGLMFGSSSSTTTDSEGVL